MGNPNEPTDWTRQTFIPAPTTPEAAYRLASEAKLQASLKPCPFCGDTPKLHMKNWSGERDTIICHCGLTMGFDGKTVDFLVGRWNNRKSE